jgi:hypothetical protein
VIVYLGNEAQRNHLVGKVLFSWFVPALTTNQLAGVVVLLRELVVHTVLLTIN